MLAPVVQHAVDIAEKIQNKKYSNIIYLQPTAPLCQASDIVQAVQMLSENSSFESVVAVTEAETHPFRLKRITKCGSLVNYIDQGFEDNRPRQDLLKVFRRAGQYMRAEEMLL